LKTKKEKNGLSVGATKNTDSKHFFSHSNRSHRSFITLEKRIGHVQCWTSNSFLKEKKKKERRLILRGEERLEEDKRRMITREKMDLQMPSRKLLQGKGWHDIKMRVILESSFCNSYFSLVDGGKKN
jgi:hypothetical protein